MRDILLSEVAQRQAAQFSTSQQREFDEICARISELLPVLERARLVRRARFYGVEGYRYLDRLFPYLIVFEVAVDQPSEMEVILIQLILPVAIRG